MAHSKNDKDYYNTPTRTTTHPIRRSIEALIKILNSATNKPYTCKELYCVLVKRAKENRIYVSLQKSGCVSSAHRGNQRKKSFHPLLQWCHRGRGQKCGGYKMQKGGFVRPASYAGLSHLERKHKGRYDHVPGLSGFSGR